VVGGVEAHEVVLGGLIFTHTHPPFTYAGVECEHTTRSSFTHSETAIALTRWVRE
jgi:hypothetical protein